MIGFRVFLDKDYKPLVKDWKKITCKKKGQWRDYAKVSEGNILEAPE